MAPAIIVHSSTDASGPSRRAARAGLILVVEDDLRGSLLARKGAAKAQPPVCLPIATIEGPASSLLTGSHDRRPSFQFALPVGKFGARASGFFGRTVALRPSVPKFRQRQTKLEQIAPISLTGRQDRKESFRSRLPVGRIGRNRSDLAYR